MNNPLPFFAHMAAAFVVVLVAACGSGSNGPESEPDAAVSVHPTTPEAPLSSNGVGVGDAATDEGRMVALSALNADAPATSLTVRARGTLMGNVGPQMSIRVDGITVASTEVRAQEPSNYTFSVPLLRPGSKVDVVFTNDVDRDLFVDYLIAGTTVVLPTSPGVTFDRGSGAAAFDGANVIAGQAAMYWGGALRIASWPLPNMTDRLTIRASGSVAGGVPPLMTLRVDGVIVGSTEVRSTEPADFTFAVPPLAIGSKVDVAFTNDAVVNGEDRNLRVAYLIAGRTVVLPTAQGAVFDKGNDLAAFDGTDVSAGTGTMGTNGALRLKWPGPNLTENVTVRASGSLADGTGPLMQLRVDGVVMGTAEVRSSDAVDFNFPVPPLVAGNKVDIVFLNDAVMAGSDRNLFVYYAISGRTAVPSNSPGTFFDQGSKEAAFDGVDVVPGRSSLNTSGALRIQWPAPNLTERVTVRASGTLAANTGPVIQLRVDGVIVGSQEVRAADLADYSFDAPPLKAGAKVDVVYTNDATINGADRNLVVDYILASKTFIRATSTGVVFDRGTRAAAWDGIDLLPGQTSIYSNGALRTTWPAPNVTGTVTLRASGTLAGNVAPVLRVRVDGVTFAEMEVRAATPTDHVIAVPPVRAGAKVDVVLTNGGSIDGQTRSVNLAYLLTSDTLARTSTSGVTFDRGSGSAAFDGVDVVAGQGAMLSNGAWRITWPATNMNDSITLRARGTLAANVGPMVLVRVDGVVVGIVEIHSTVDADYSFKVPSIAAGSKVDVVYLNDETVNGEDRNFFIRYLTVGGKTLLPTAAGVQLYTSTAEAALDGSTTAPGVDALYAPGSLRFTVPPPSAPDPTLPAQNAASSFLQQATFGPTLAEISRLAAMPYGNWLTEQFATAPRPDYVTYVQGKYDRGDAYRPYGTDYRVSWVEQRFWANAARASDPLRQRMTWALHQIFMVSQVDTNLHPHARAYASYLDTLNRHAFGNFRTLLEEVALSPAMGIYLSHMRNRKEDPATGRLPDENFAREVMQLFTIGLHELNLNGTQKLDANGRPIETYNNGDVMALAKVFTGFSWAFPDPQLTEQNFRWGIPKYDAASDQRIDLLKMRAYPGQHSTAEKRLFSGKPHAVIIPANGTALESVRVALDTLFRHPNVGPFIGRQLIQRLVSSHPSPEYVARVAAAFNNNGQGVRGDLSAVVRAILLDNEARNPPSSAVGKLREPVVRVAHWMRSFAATSITGEFMIAGELGNQSQRAINAPSVFGYFRPGYVPPNTTFSANGITVPELQIVNESSTALWLNLSMSMASTGIGWTGTTADVAGTLEPLLTLVKSSGVDAMLDRINLLLFAGRMSAALRSDLIDAVAGVSGGTDASHLNRVRVALFLALASPEYMVQR